MTRHGSDWLFSPIYTFKGHNDGVQPAAPVVFGPDGSLYGTTQFGGVGCNQLGCGTVYNLRPPARICGSLSCPWTKTILYEFAGSPDGAEPLYGSLVFDPANNIYGTTIAGGTDFGGIAFELTKTDGAWTETVLHSFADSGQSGGPQSGVVLDAAGNLYGASLGAPHGYGRVYELVKGGTGWSEKVLHAFQGGDDGAFPYSSLIFDAAGIAYGTTEGSGEQRSTVFQLTRGTDGNWTETVLYEFPAGSYGPRGALAMDTAGNLYGSTYGLGADRFGFVFKMTHAGGSWSFTHLYDFTNGADGAYPIGGVTLDSAGNLFGTCVDGGANGYGTIWEITP